jgi:hypothetical protein
MIEAERVRAPQDGKDKSAVPGARLDPSTGRVLAWCVHTRDAQGGFTFKHAEEWLPGLIHPTYRWRPDQVRGWPMLSVVANMVTDIKEINDANLRKNKMGAMAAWVYSKGQSGGSLQGRTPATSSAGQPLQKFTEGQIYEIEQGANLAPFANSQPGAEYAPFMEFNLRMVGMALGLPYEFLLLYFGGGNFASSKASLLQAYKTIETWQAWVECEFLRPVTAFPEIRYAAAREAKFYEVVQSIRTLSLAGQAQADKRRGDFSWGREIKVSPGMMRDAEEIAERCEFVLPIGGLKFPRFAPPDGSSPREFLARLACEGMRWRYGAAPSGGGGRESWRVRHFRA